MKLRRYSPISGVGLAARPLVSQRGSVLVIVMWIAIGLVSLALYFADSMNSELRASENRVSGQSAEQAIEGAERYVHYLLASQISNGSNGMAPVLGSLQCQAVPVGESHFWLIGRNTTNAVTTPNQVSFGLVDEASRLNLNTATSNALAYLPRMNDDLNQAIMDWRDTNGTGPTVSYYVLQQPSYICKNDPFETVDELRLLYGVDMDVLVGEDINRNGVLDPGENDENSNNQSDPGILEYLTVYTREPNTNADGSLRINITNLTANLTQFTGILQTNFGDSRAQEILSSLNLSSSNSSVSFASPLALYVQSGMSLTEFAQLFTNITTVGTDFIAGRVNVNTASLTVLTCLLEGDSGAAQQLIDYRQTNPNNLSSIGWVSEALSGSSSALQTLEASDCITTLSYQFTADIAAVGPHGRGYRRVKYVFDTSTGTPQIVYRQDLTHLGWALGKDARDQWLLAKGTR